MTAQKSESQLQPPLWRRAWFWIVAVVVLVAVIVAVVIGVVMNQSRQQPSAQQPHALLVSMLNRVDDTVHEAGGAWPGWTTKTAGYTGVPCGSSDASAQQYSLSITSSGDPDPATAAAKMIKHWRSLGYSVRTVVPTDASNHDVTQVAADFPGGAAIGYSVSTVNSSIDASSECSTDPGMLHTTK
jgi:hypothetical protein